MDNFLKIALEGYKGFENKHYWSSDNWLAHQTGLLFRSKGLSTPTQVKKSRGYSFRVLTNDNEFIVKFNKNLNDATIERK